MQERMCSRNPNQSKCVTQIPSLGRRLPGLCLARRLIRVRLDLNLPHRPATIPTTHSMSRQEDTCCSPAHRPPNYPMHGQQTQTLTSPAGKPASSQATCSAGPSSESASTCILSKIPGACDSAWPCLPFCPPLARGQEPPS